MRNFDNFNPNRDGNSAKILVRYDRGDSFPFDFEPNGVPFGSKSKGKMFPRSHVI